MPGFVPPPNAAAAPTAVRNARYCWFGVLGIFAINLLINLINGDPQGIGFLGLASVVFANRGAMRLSQGRRGGRTLATVFGAILAVLQVLTCFLVVGFAMLRGFLVFYNLGVSVLIIGLITAATVLMFRPEVTAFCSHAERTRMRLPTQ